MEEVWLKNGKKRRPIITVLDKMIAQDLLKTLISVWAVIVVIISSRAFIKILDKAIEGQISNETLLVLLSLKMLIISINLLPPAAFMAVLMVLGRMYRDQEMAAVASAGGGAGTIYRAIFLIIFPLTLVAAGLSFYAGPWAEAKMTKLVHQDKETSDIRGIAAGKFSEYSQGDLVFYVENITDDKKMHQVFVQQRQKNSLAIVNSKSARFQDFPDGRYLVLEQGERVLGFPGQIEYVIEKFDEYAVRIEEISSEVNFERTAIPFDVLWKSDIKPDIAELQRRFSIPLSIMLLTFLGVPLAQLSPRGGVYGNILIGFLIYFSYGNFVRVSQVWVIKESIPAWLGGIGVNIFLLLVGGLLLARYYGWRWLLIKAEGKISL
ncbi:MAG: LPS export ABC transporter permease LptF [Methylococcaceae bacterium]